MTIDIDNLKGTTVLVTGGAGFIGSHLIDGLLQRGAKVRVLDNLETGHKRNVEHALDQIDFIEGDIRDLDTCQKATAGADYVLHQAALGSVPRSLELPAASIDSNVGGTTNVFTAARDQKVKRVVYASSSSVYGDDERLPKKEGHEGNVLSPYAISKWMNEELADVYERCYGMQLVGLRYFNVYGPRQDPQGAYAAVIPKFFDICRKGGVPTIYGDGEQSRDFTFVADVVRANLLAMRATSGSGRAYNIGAGGRTTVTDLAETIMKVTGVDGKPKYEDPRAGDIKHSLADFSDMEKAFGWKPEFSLTAGLAKTAEFYA